MKVYPKQVHYTPAPHELVIEKPWNWLVFDWT
jgi:hypothetical protein